MINIVNSVDFMCLLRYSIVIPKMGLGD